MKKIFTDTETTGLSFENDQIVSFSSIIEDEQGEIVESSEFFINLKPCINPSPSALMVTNINSFSPDFIKKAQKEEFIKDYLIQISDSKLLFIAYNSAFDEQMYAAVLQKYGINYYNIYRKRFDPLKTVRVLINKGVLQTPVVQKGFNSYRSAKLEDVYNTLGYDSSAFQAHTALDDTKMLQMVAYGIFFLATGRDLSKIKNNAESLVSGDIVQFVVDCNEEGVKTKSVYVLQNKVEFETLQVVDVNGHTELISYHQIYDQFEAEEKEVKILKKDFDHLKIEILAPFNHIKNPEIIVYNVEDIEKELVLLKDKSNAEKKNYFDSLDKEKFNQIKNYSYSKYYSFCDIDVYGKEYDVLPDVLNMHDFKIVFEKTGEYKLIRKDELLLTTSKKTELESFLKPELEQLIVYDKELLLSKMFWEIKESFDKIYVVDKSKKKEKIVKEFSDIDELDVFLRDFFEKDFKTLIIKEDLKKIISTKSFVIDKHPLKIKAEYENIKNEVFNGSNKKQKDILKDLLTFYQQKYPTYFLDIKMPSFQLDLSSFLKK